MNKLSVSFFTIFSLIGNLKSQERPNILWLTFEDTSPQFIGCYGDSNAKTPNIDKLASEGIRFTSAFSTGAVSSPSRFCLFTGIRPTTMGTGHHRSNYPIPESIEGFPFYLREAGYYTTNNSKTDYNLANANKLTKQAWNESSSRADWRNRKAGQPFFAIYNSPSSHQSRTMTNPWNLYEQQILNNLDKKEQTQGGKLEMPSIYMDSPEMQKHLSRVYNSITLTDKEFGQWLDKLESDGLRDSTIIFCFSDHGEGIPRGKGSPVGMGYRVPFIAWFPPMYAHLSPWKNGGIVTDELISFEDLAATMLSIAGVELPPHLEGRSFAGSKRQPEKKYVYSAVDRLDHCTDLCRSITDGQFIYTRVFTCFMPFLSWNKYYDVSEIQKTIRVDFESGRLNKTQQSILLPREAEYLYDLKNDKWETTNLISRKEHQEKAAEFRSELRNYLENNRDAHFIPEFYLKDKNQIPYNTRKNNDFYPTKEVMDAAYLSGKGIGVIGEQIKYLNHSNPIVRYWAAIGLYAQQKGIQKYEKQLYKRLKELPDEPAKIYLAATLFKYCENSGAENELLKMMNHENIELVRNTLQACMYLNQTQKEKLLPAIKLLWNNNKTNKKLGQLNDFCEIFIYYVEKTGELTYDTWW